MKNQCSITVHCVLCFISDSIGKTLKYWKYRWQIHPKCGSQGDKYPERKRWTDYFRNSHSHYNYKWLLVYYTNSFSFSVFLFSHWIQKMSWTEWWSQIYNMQNTVKYPRLPVTLTGQRLFGVWCEPVERTESHWMHWRIFFPSKFNVKSTKYFWRKICSSEVYFDLFHLLKNMF